jgi:hypothetical protein
MSGTAEHGHAALHGQVAHARQQAGLADPSLALDQHDYCRPARDRAKLITQELELALATDQRSPEDERHNERIANDTGRGIYPAFVTVRVSRIRLSCGHRPSLGGGDPGRALRGKEDARCPPDAMAPSAGPRRACC